MARPKLKHTVQMCTIARAAALLGIKIPQLRRRLKSGAFAPPTLVDENGTRYFGGGWLARARVALELEKNPEAWLALIELQPAARLEGVGP